MPIRLFDQTIGFLQKSLDIRTFRHKVLSDNIANVATPLYRPKDIPFQKMLERSFIQGSNLDSPKTEKGHLYGAGEFPLELDISGEEVNVDREMARLTENNLMYQAGVQALVKKLEAIRLTLVEGGR